jgi:hypothetical protein
VTDLPADLGREPIDLDAVERHTYIAAADAETVRRMAQELRAYRAFVQAERNSGVHAPNASSGCASCRALAEVDRVTS